MYLNAIVTILPNSQKRVLTTPMFFSKITSGITLPAKRLFFVNYIVKLENFSNWNDVIVIPFEVNVILTRISRPDWYLVMHTDALGRKLNQNIETAVNITFTLFLLMPYEIYATQVKMNADYVLEIRVVFCTTGDWRAYFFGY